MKTYKLFSLLSVFMSLAILSFAQTATENIPVSGNCGMCKNKIEKTAKQAGASTATWNVKTKTLTIKYSSATTNTAKIQQSIAAVGYDTRDFKANEDAYNKLDACCQYDREATAAIETKLPSAEKTTAACCSKTNAKAACCDKKDGKTASNTSKEKSCCAGTH